MLVLVFSPADGAPVAAMMLFPCIGRGAFTQTPSRRSCFSSGIGCTSRARASSHHVQVGNTLLCYSAEDVPGDPVAPNSDNSSVEEERMDYFEATVARVLEEQGYWVRQNVRVDLAKDVKKALGKPRLPRCELDIVAYRPTERQLVLFEGKSYLDSYGVQPEDLRRTDWQANRYKILT